MPCDARVGSSTVTVPATGMEIFVTNSRGPLDEDGDAADKSDSDNDVWKAAVFGALDGVLTSFAVVAGAAGVCASSTGRVTHNK